MAGLEAELASSAMEKTEMKMEISKRAGELQRCKDELREWQKEHNMVTQQLNYAERTIEELQESLQHTQTESREIEDELIDVSGQVDRLDNFCSLV